MGLYEELRYWLRDLAYAARLLPVVDKAALGCALLMMISMFLPWISATGFTTESGLLGARLFYCVVSIFTLLTVKSVVHNTIKAVRRHRAYGALPARLRRASLYYVLLGICSILVAIGVLGYFGLARESMRAVVVIRIGFYLAPASGLLLLFCGLLRFQKNMQ